MIHNGKEYRPIPDFPNYYISKDGCIVKTKSPNDFRLVKNRLGGNYIVVGLTDKDHSHRTTPLHRVLLAAWGRPPEEGEMARHLNDNPMDNRLENLAWGTMKQNGEDRTRNNKAMTQMVIKPRKYNDAKYVRLMPETHRRMKEKAKREGRFLERLIDAALREWLDRNLKSGKGK